jgi:hypothetical protein
LTALSAAGRLTINALQANLPGAETCSSATQEALEYPIVPHRTTRRFRLMDALKGICLPETLQRAARVAPG